ncbi:MAG: hypothetical protein NTV65_06880 [Proteobacteria bacterium]|nr:hypothetical protein [Pseudomonadota bacterium]
MNGCLFGRRRLISAILDIYWKLSGRRTSDSDSLILHLRSILRRFPFWAEGHLALAELCINTGDIAAAYASGHALKALSTPNSFHSAQALFILGRCFLRKGEWQSALIYLCQAHAILPTLYAIHEEEAAALMLSEDYSAALKALAQIPSERLSAEGKAALEFAKMRMARELALPLQR